MGDRRIIQIVPATGWIAKYKDEYVEDDPIRAPVVCWALVEDKKGTRSVVGLMAMDLNLVDFCDETENFMGYEYDQNAKLG